MQVQASRVVTQGMLSGPMHACRRLARKYHPDKNPAGREKFVAVQKAYERLQAGAAAGKGPQSWRLLLILKVLACPSQSCRAFLLSYAEISLLLSVTGCQ